MTQILYVGNDNIVRLSGVKDASNGDTRSTATVTYVLRNAADTSDVVASTSMTAVADYPGRYEGTIQDSAALTAGTRYLLKVTADDGATRKGLWSVECEARLRS